MQAWVIPVHDHVLVAEMPDHPEDSRLEIRGCQHEVGEPCPRCDLAVRRLVNLLLVASLGCVQATHVP